MSIADRRARFTEDMIRSVFQEMLLEMPVDRITVSDISRKCEINRGTFYLHYSDCFALYKTLGTELAERMIRVIREKYSVQDAMRAMMAQSLSMNPVEKILFNDRRSGCFSLLFDSAKEITISNWKQRCSLTEEQLSIVFTYVFEGCYALSNTFFTEAKAVNDSSLSFLYSLIANGVQSLIPQQQAK